MAKRVVVSALVGVLAGAILVDPVIDVLYQHYVIHNDYWLTIGRLEAIGIMLGRAPGTAVIGLIIASPLIGIAVATGVLFRKRIDRHPLLWAGFAPVLVWLFTCVISATTIANSWAAEHGFVDRLVVVMRGIDNSLFFFAPAAAALCFAILSRRAAASGGSAHP